MSTHNIGFYEEISKISLNYLQISSNSIHTLSLLLSFSEEEQTKRVFDDMSCVTRKPVFWVSGHV